MFSIEKATLADCPLIQTLASNIWEPTYGSILSREQLDYMFEMMYSNESLQKQMSELITSSSSSMPTVSLPATCLSRP